MSERMCSVEDCESAHAARGLCSRHWQQWRGGVDHQALPTYAERGPLRQVDANGYIRLSIAGQIVYEHRYVWERAHGPIPDGFHVHHRNHDRADNRLENLSLIEGREHNRRHTLARHQAGTLAVRGSASPRYLTDLPDAEIVRLRDEQGMSFRAIGRRFGRDHGVIICHYRRHKAGEGIGAR